MNYVNYLRKKLISALFILIHFLTSSQLDCPKIDRIALPSRPRQVAHLYDAPYDLHACFWLVVAYICHCRHDSCHRRNDDNDVDESPTVVISSCSPPSPKCDARDGDNAPPPPRRSNRATFPLPPLPPPVNVRWRSGIIIASTQI